LRTSGKTSTANLGDCAPKLLVRVIFAGSHDCNDLAFRPGVHIPLAMQARSNPDTDAFPVTLCEGVAEYADKAGTFPDGESIPWDGLEQLRHVVVIGDSGCNNDKNRTRGRTVKGPRLGHFEKCPRPRRAVDATQADRA